jgi:Uncharacterized conserved protein
MKIYHLRVKALPMSVDERKAVLTELEEALKRFIEDRRSYLLIPEIRTNLGYSLPDPKGVGDVAAIPGRLTVAFNRVIYCLPPAFGASDHVARVIITANKHDRNVRSAMNLALYPQFKERLNAYVFDRRREPQGQKNVEGRTMNFMVESAFQETGRIPDYILDLGDYGKEPGTFVLGRNPMEVVEKALFLLTLL